MINEDKVRQKLLEISEGRYEQPAARKAVKLKTLKMKEKVNFDPLDIHIENQKETNKPYQKLLLNFNNQIRIPQGRIVNKNHQLLKANVNEANSLSNSLKKEREKVDDKS